VKLSFEVLSIVLVLVYGLNDGLAQAGIKRIESFYYEDILQESYRREYMSLIKFKEIMKKNK